MRNFLKYFLTKILTNLLTYFNFLEDFFLPIILFLGQVKSRPKAFINDYRKSASVIWFIFFSSLSDVTKFSILLVILMNFCWRISYWEIAIPTCHTACTLFWIPKRQAIYTDNGFIFKKINENIKERKLSDKPFQNYLLIGQATSAKKAG